MSLAFSADGKTLVSGSLDQNVLVWDVPGGKVSKTLTGHTQTIYAVAIAPAGDFVASAGGATENDVKTNSATATSAVVKLWKVK
jgi:WD40 repeat protein